MKSDVQVDLQAAKTLWKRDKNQDIWSFYCPNCRTERRLPFNPKPGRFQHYVQVALTSAVFTLLTWQWFGARGFVSFLPFWAAFEIFHRTRVRAKIGCPYCGFDPYLYLVDIKRARDEIEKHWRAKFAEKGIPYPDSSSPGAAAKSANPGLTETRTGR